MRFAQSRPESRLLELRTFAVWLVWLRCLGLRAFVVLLSAGEWAGSCFFSDTISRLAGCTIVQACAAVQRARRGGGGDDGGDDSDDGLDELVGALGP